MALGLERLGDGVLRPEIRVEALDGRGRRGQGAAPIEPRRDRVVREPRAIAHAPAIDLAPGHRAVGADRDIDDDRQPVGILVERREIGRHALGQHRKDLRRRVHGRRIHARVGVEGRILRHRGVDVGHRDQDPPRTGRRVRRDGELIEIARVVVVDRAPEEVAEIAQRACAVRLAAGGFRLGAGGGGEVGLEPALQHGAAGDVTQTLARVPTDVHEDGFMIAWTPVNSRTAEVVVCGAGIAGIATAFHLTRQGVNDVVLVDERSPLSLTSDKSAECYRNWWPGPGDAMVAAMNRSIDLLEELARESGNVFRMNRRGYLFATADPERVPQFVRAAQEAEALGAGAARLHATPGSDYQPPAFEAFEHQPIGTDVITERSLIRRHFGWLAEDTVALLHSRRCGWFSGQQLGMYMLERAREKGVRLL